VKESATATSALLARAPQAAVDHDALRTPPTAYEIATGLLYGECSVPAVGDLPASPRAVLDDLLRPYLARTPCVIAFSGGRDSSALLAAAVSLAGREGLSPPVAVTLLYDSAATDEREWQERVIGHVGVGDWIRLKMTDELDFVGPLAGEGLRRHGVMYPANAHVIVPLAEQAQGGSVLTGVGGDDVFGNWPWNDTASLLARRRSAQLRDAKRLALAVSPLRLRAEALRRRAPYTLPWIRLEVRRDVALRIATELSSAPRTWGPRMRWSARWRPWRVGAGNIERLGADHGASVGAPFLEPRLLESLALAGGHWGWGNRTETMRALFADLLPPDVITRTTKAEFSEPFFGEQTRSFAERWDGRSGLDTSIVEADALRQIWSGRQPHFFSTMALQSAWLASERRR
jgi:asparagine synthase (glutamine-hydrolysing)